MEKLLQHKAEMMERSSLSIKEEKAQLAEMKKMKEDNKKLQEWEAEMDNNRNERSSHAEKLRLVYDQIDSQRNVQWHAEVGEKLGMSQEELTDLRLPISEGMAELLGSPVWKKKLQTEHQVWSKMERGGSRAVRLTGSQEAVEAAAKVIQAYGPVEVRHLPLDEEQQGLLIGKRGSTISQLQDSTSCTLDIKKGTNMLHIIGPKGQVEQAAGMIHQLFVETAGLVAHC